MKPYIISEIACAHLGDPELCGNLIKNSKKAGADGVKLQIWQADDIKNHPFRENMLRFELTQDDWTVLAALARAIDLDLWVEATSRESIEFAKGLSPYAWKIPYQKFLDDVKLVDDIDEPVFWRVSADLPVYGNNVAIGEQQFPTSLEDAKKELELVKHFIETGRNVIYSDHQDAYHWQANTLPALAAYHAGADYIEKHICYDRFELAKDSKDHTSALEGHEFEQFVKYMHENPRHGKVRAIL